MENCFDDLKAPVARYQKPSVPQPFSPALEAEVTNTAAKIIKIARQVINGTVEKTRYIPVSGITYKTTAENNIEVKPLQNSTESTTLNKQEATRPMNKSIAVIIPNQGLTITEVSIAKWHKNVGEEVKNGEPLLDVESEKSLIEMESPADGRLEKIVAPVGTTVPNGAEIAYIAER